jgi:hypothetical protein
MNMIVGAATVATARPVAAVEPDPIFAAIEAHKAAYMVHEATVGRYSDFERELQANDRLQRDRRHEDERQRGEDIEAAIDEAHDATTDAAVALVNIRPTTEAGLLALLSYAITADIDGEVRPRSLDSDDSRDITRPWHFFLIENVAAAITLGPSGSKLT